TLRVRQERFFVDPKVPPAKRRQRWPVPLVVKVGANEGPDGVARALVDKPSQTVPLQSRSPGWLYGNAAAGGVYRVRHDAVSLAALLRELYALSAVERLALVGDQWALVRAARAPVETFLDLADVLGDEPDHDVLDGVAGSLAVLDEQVLEPASAEQAAL